MRFNCFFHFVLGLAFGLAVTPEVAGEAPAMKDGGTVWVYEIGVPMTQLPTLVASQTPNYYNDHPEIDFTGSWNSPYGEMSQFYYGHIFGNIKIPVGGTYEFRVTSEDGAKLSINGAVIVDNDVPGENASSAAVNILPGSYPFALDFYRNNGGGRVRLEWKPPGQTAFGVVPTTALETQQGQTYVTSPGPKNYYYENGVGGTAGGPGDGRPLTGVHPGFNLVNFRPSGFQPKVGGMDFLPDGRLVICTWDTIGAVYILDNLIGSGVVSVSRYAEGLGEPLGIKVVDGSIYVAQKQEITKLTDIDGDGVADEYEAVAHGWPASPNYHEFTMNLVYKDGALWCATSTPLKTGDISYLPGSEPAFPVPNGPGSLLRIVPEARTWEIVANGLRTPNGMGLGVDGEIFCGDNQGGWLPSSKLNHLTPGAFYGAQVNPTDSRAYKAPTLWLPQGEISNSPTEPVLIQSGPYAGQMLIAELTHGGINRAFLEKINGDYQGAVFQFTQGLEAGAHRLVWGPDGALYVGGIGSGGNWNWEDKLFGLQKLQPNGSTTFEMKSVRSRADGFVIELTQPVPLAILTNPESYTIQQWFYTPSIAYGGSKQGQATLTPGAIQVSTDRKRVFLKLPSMQVGRVTYFRLKNFTNDSGTAPWATEAWYTLNNRGAEAGPDFTPRLAPMQPVEEFVTRVTRYEAEHAVFSGAGVGSSNPGYSGSGYVDYMNATSDYIEWTVEAAEAGVHHLGFRYALGATDSRGLQIVVNGTVVQSSLAFPSTGSWTEYRTVESSAVLNAGVNIVRATAIGSSGGNIDRLDLTAPAPPPAHAVVLFDGASAAGWVRNADGSPANWPVANGYMEVRHSPSPNDIVSVQKFKDFQLHIEWWAPFGGVGQAAGNSGIKLQRRYELQVLNTSSSKPIATYGNDEAGSIYLTRKPDSNESRGPGAWQIYDVIFTAARWSGTTKVSNARMTVYWNGVRVHHNVEVTASTGASLLEAPGPDSILLQDHTTDASGEVRFRNVWAIPVTSFGEQWTSWKASSGLSDADGAPDSDPDRDGMVNLWEYTAGGNPMVSDAGRNSFLAQMTVVSIGEQEYLQFKYRRRVDYAERGLRIVAEISPNLLPNSWLPVGTTQVGSLQPSGDGVTEFCTMRINQAIVPGSPSLFARFHTEILQ